MLLAPGKLDDTRGLNSQEQASIDLSAIIMQGVTYALDKSMKEGGEQEGRVDTLMSEAGSAKKFVVSIVIKAKPE